MTTVIAGALLVVTAGARTNNGEYASQAERAGAFVGSVLGAFLIGLLIVYVVMRIADRPRTWLVPIALGVGVVVNLVVLAAG